MCVSNARLRLYGSDRVNLCVVIVAAFFGFIATHHPNFVHTKQITSNQSVDAIWDLCIWLRSHLILFIDVPVFVAAAAVILSHSCVRWLVVYCNAKCECFFPFFFCCCFCCLLCRSWNKKMLRAREKTKVKVFRVNQRGRLMHFHRVLHTKMSARLSPDHLCAQICVCE